METPPGKVIRSLRQALDMTQAEFARAAGWSASTISSWERGSTQPSRIAFKTILAFAEERAYPLSAQGRRRRRPDAEPQEPETLPVLRLGSRLPPPPLVARDSGREESFGSRRWTDLATYDLDAETEGARRAAVGDRTIRCPVRVARRPQPRVPIGTSTRACS
jgi:transcriptional regulator with XRE-family HTH domain